MITSPKATGDRPALTESGPDGPDPATGALAEPAATSRSRRTEWLLVVLLLILAFGIVLEFGVLYVSLLTQAP